MTATREQRRSTRINRHMEILLDNPINDSHHRARMTNFSPEGMHFLADYAPLPGSDIYIGVTDSPYDTGSDLYRAQVRWRRKLPAGSSEYSYGVGVRYYHPAGN
jgi:hypothetical protein